MSSSLPNFGAFLKKLDSCIASESDIEIDDGGDMFLKELKGIERGDLFVVKQAFTSDTGTVQLSPDDVGIVALVRDDGKISVTVDKQEARFWIYPEQFANLRLVPKGFRHQFRKDHGSGYTKAFDKDEQKKHGVVDIIEEMSRVDDIIANAQVFFDKVLETGRALSAIESVWAMRENLRTYVLATVTVPGWHSSWASSIPLLVASHSRFCSKLTMASVKGGKACDKEIEFIVALMPKMGFKVVQSAVKHVIKDAGLMMLTWEWKRERSGGWWTAGADDYSVELAQYQNVEDVPMLAQSMPPERKHCQAPNLKRLAVVSAPVDDKSEQPINERLNVLLLKMLDGAAIRAAKKGFRPEAFWNSSEENNRIHREYFDLPVNSLADMGIKPTG